MADAFWPVPYNNLVFYTKSLEQGNEKSSRFKKLKKKLLKRLRTIVFTKNSLKCQESSHPKNSMIPQNPISIFEELKNKVMFETIVKVNNNIPRNAKLRLYSS